MSGIVDVPKELLGDDPNFNALPGLRAHFAALKQGVELDREVKLIVLGNGRVGKTSMIRVLKEGEFSSEEQTTHGVQFWPWELSAPEPGDPPIKVNVWDFGGQDIYLGTHAMFLRGRAVFVITWDRETEKTQWYEDKEGEYRHRNYPLQYWLDYVEHVSPGSPVIVVETKCSSEGAHVPVKGSVKIDHERVSECWYNAAATKTSQRNESRLRELLSQAAEQCLGTPEAQRMGVGRWGAKQRLRAMVAEGEPKTMTRAEFDALCGEHRLDPAHNGLFLALLHHSGVVFHREGHFGDAIVLDQRWACDAIYTVLHRRECLKLIRLQHGRFTASDLAVTSWKEHPEPDRALFLSMMQQCAICFEIGMNAEGELEYLAPELAPPWATVANRVAWPAQGEALCWRYDHDFLGPDAMRRAMCKVGEKHRDAATYWNDDLRAGFYLPDNELGAQALVQAEYWVGGDASRGRITIQVRGSEGAREEMLLRMRELFEGGRRYWERRQQRDARGVSVSVSRDGSRFVLLEEIRKQDAAGNHKVVAPDGSALPLAEWRWFLDIDRGDVRNSMGGGSAMPTPSPKGGRRFLVGLSFPGEKRGYVLAVAEALAKKIDKDRILYDEWYRHEFARPDLDTYLQGLYHDESSLIVPFLCADYEKKEWCCLEWRAIRDILKRRRGEDIMPMRFDNTEIPGLFSIDGYIDVSRLTPDAVAEDILKRLGSMGLL